MPVTPILAIPYVAPLDLINAYPATDQASATRLDDLLRPVFGSYTRSTNQSVATATQVTVIGTQVSAEGGITHNGTTGEVTVPLPGLYLFTAWVTWAANAVSYRYAWWQKNGARVTFVKSPAGATTTSDFTMISNGVSRCVAGDKASFVVQQNTGASLDLIGGSSLTMYQVARIAP